jgi:hypothetical protein
MPREKRKSRRGSSREKMKRSLVLLLSCPLIEVQNLGQRAEGVIHAVELLKNFRTFFLQVQLAEFLGIKKLGQIESFDQNLSLVPPVPEPESVVNLLVFYRFNRGKPAVPEDLLNCHHSLSRKKIPLDEDDIRIPFNDLLERDDCPDSPEIRRQKLLRQVYASGDIDRLIEDRSPGESRPEGKVHSRPVFQRHGDDRIGDGLDFFPEIGNQLLRSFLQAGDSANQFYFLQEFLEPA